MVRIVTDSTSDLPQELIQKWKIVVVPLYVRFGNETYRDGIDLSAEEFYNRLLSSPVLPTTSAPSVGDFIQVYKELPDEEIVSIHISSKLSATCEVARNAAGELSKMNIEIVDSLSFGLGLGLLVIEAALLSQKGLRAQEIASHLRQLVPKVGVFGMVDTLDYLQRGGRIGKAQAFLGSLLKIKPILSIKDGEVYPLERVRSRSKAIERLYEIACDFSPIQAMGVFHSTTPKEAEDLKERLRTIFSGEIYLARLGPVVGTHLGPGALGIALITT